MVVEAQRLPFESLARLAEALAAGSPLGDTLDLIAQAAVEATRAELAVDRVLDERDGVLVARAIAPSGSSHAAEVSGSRLDVGSEPGPGRVLVAARAGERLVGAIELHGDLDRRDQPLAELVAANLAIALHESSGGAAAGTLPALRRIGEALAAGAEPERAARQGLREATGATGAQHGVIWRSVGERLEPMAWHGTWDEDSVAAARAAALEARSAWQPLLVSSDPPGARCTVSIRLGEPSFG